VVREWCRAPAVTTTLTLTLLPARSCWFREIDIEIARWGVPTDPTGAQFVVQP
jgi:hypothetical protein